MSQWLILIVLAVCAGAFLGIPFLRRGAPAEPGQIDATPGSTKAQPAGLRRVDAMTAITIAVVVITGAVAVHFGMDQSGLPASQATGLPVQSAQPKLPDVDTMIARVAERLKTNPDNAEDWRMLGWSYFETQRYLEAIDAYAHAVALQPASAAFQSAYGEAQVLAAGGKVTPEALKAFKTALRGAPNDERALHFAGLAKSQSGDPKGAIADWSLALKNVSPNSLWVPRLRAAIAEAGSAASIDVSNLLPPPSAAGVESFSRPPPDSVQQAQTMSPQERQAMIKTMVAGLDDRLTRNPRDREGWVRLIRSRKVLGETELARTALARALAAFADDPATQTDLQAAAMQLGVTPVP
jgi:cytochrome c-type biogenesis protein CcmH